jgi:hypothetical protein
MNEDAKSAIRALAENGNHFLESTLGEVGKVEYDLEGNRNAVIFMAAALEVLLKARLAAEHWTLLFDDPGTAKISRLKSGEFQSVGARKLVDRLNNAASLKLPKEVPERIFNLRNSVVHFAPPSGFAVRVEIAAGLNYILNHVSSDVEALLADSEKEAHQALTNRILAVFQDLDDFREKRLETLADKLRTCSLLVACPECTQSTLRIDGSSEASCLFCLSKFVPEELAERYVNSFLSWGLHGEFEGYAPVGPCFECGEETLVLGVQVVNRPKIAYLCFSCGTNYKQHEIATCSRCGQWMLESDEMTTCNDCWRALAEQHA